MCNIETNGSLLERFWTIGVAGTVIALFGVICNAMLTIIFLTRRMYRHSPFFFLGFVAFYDTLLDFNYIILLVIVFLIILFILINLFVVSINANIFK